MGDGPNDPKPLEVPLVGHRRILVDVDGADWRVAFYYPDHPPAKVRELEKRARTGSQTDRNALARLPMRRGSARDPMLRDALTRAMTRRVAVGHGAERTIPPELAEVETITRYILEGRYALAVGRRE